MSLCSHLLTARLACERHPASRVRLHRLYGACPTTCGIARKDAVPETAGHGEVDVCTSMSLIQDLSYEHGFIRTAVPRMRTSYGLAAAVLRKSRRSSPQPRHLSHKRNTQSAVSTSHYSPQDGSKSGHPPLSCFANEYLLQNHDSPLIFGIQARSIHSGTRARWTPSQNVISPETTATEARAPHSWASNAGGARGGELQCRREYVPVPPPPRALSTTATFPYIPMTSPKTEYRYRVPEVQSSPPAQPRTPSNTCSIRYLTARRAHEQPTPPSTPTAVPASPHHRHGHANTPVRARPTVGDIPHSVADLLAKLKLCEQTIRTLEATNRTVAEEKERLEARNQILSSENKALRKAWSRTFPRVY